MMRRCFCFIFGLVISTLAYATPELSGSQFLRLMKSQGTIPLATAALTEKLQQLVTDPALRQQLATELADLIERQDFSRADRFPVVRLQDVSSLQLGLRPRFHFETTRIETLRGTLEALLGSCDVPRPKPQAVLAQLPTIKYGHFANLDLSDCESAHSDSFARVLTALAAGNGSWVEFGGARFTTPASLIGALIESGHRVEQRSERTLANFLSFTIEDRYNLRWPLWLDTGLAMRDGSNLIIPMEHSQYAWRVSGPTVNARFVFFLGVSGVGFFGQSDVRPDWTGLKLVHRQVSDDLAARKLVVRGIEIATQYLLRIRQEHASVARGMPADGYGYLGICNDSSAVLEALTAGEVTSFPLVRSASLATASAVRDDLNRVLQQMPHDADGVLNREDAFSRILASFPHELNSPRLLDEQLRAQLLEVATELRAP